ncbi:MAG: hypothetical protein AAB211_05025 [Pseudomonadota bacterium]
MVDFVVAIAGAVLGGFITHYVEAGFRRRDAVQKFRASFVEEIASCMSSDDFKIKQVLREALIKHRCAVIMFEPFLQKNARAKFNDLWHKYCCLFESSLLNDFVPENGIGSEGYIRELSESEQRRNSLDYLRSLLDLAS